MIVRVLVEYVDPMEWYKILSNPHGYRYYRI